MFWKQSGDGDCEERERHIAAVIAVRRGAGGDEAVELIHAGAKDYVLKDRMSRLGMVVNRALNVFLEPRNPFEPERTRKPKREAVIFGTLVAVVAAAFLFFNLAAPRLQVYP